MANKLEINLFLDNNDSVLNFRIPDVQETIMFLLEKKKITGIEVIARKEVRIDETFRYTAGFVP